MKGADFMGNNSENKPDRYINIGIVAHVDAGKTTLSESMLYHAGAIRKLGRVDHKDAFLDTDQMERERGITILISSYILYYFLSICIIYLYIFS